MKVCSDGTYVDQVAGQLACAGVILTVYLGATVTLGYHPPPPPPPRRITSQYWHTCGQLKTLTYCMNIFKDFLHTNQLIVELIICTGVG